MNSTAGSGLSKADIVRAGKVLSAKIPWEESAHAEHVKTFKTAYDWRNSHQHPMRRIRQELTGKVRKLGLDGITAGRTKRMQSIRKKLSRSTINLAQIQDLGDCRAILNSVEEVHSLVAYYRDGGTSHQITKEIAYIDSPKAGGYRSHHFVLSYQGGFEDEQFNGRKIEVQVRTRLQHAWATAVEAVGMVSGEDLKAGEGNVDWLRLFTLMSSEFADVEGCPILPGTSDRLARHEEISHLDVKLGASSTLQRINRALVATEFLSIPSLKCFLIQFDGSKMTLDVRGYAASTPAYDRYSLEEDKYGSLDTLLVEVDKAENLREAYPNYFLDVAKFADAITKVTGVARGRPTGIRRHDLSFLSEWRERSRGASKPTT